MPAVADALFIGVGQVDLYFRHARSLKDKRQVLTSLTQKLRNEGFSVTQCGDTEDLKKGSLGFSYAGHDYSHVDSRLRWTESLWIGGFQVLRFQTKILEFPTDEPFTDEELAWRDEEGGFK